MPHRIELGLSLAISAGLHLGLQNRTGRAIGDFLGNFTAYAPLPALHLAYGLCVWLSLLAACIALRRRAFGQRRTQRKPPRKRNRPTRRPQTHVGNTAETQREPVQPTPVPQSRQVPSTRPSKGEQARRLREARGGGQPNRIPVYSNNAPLWDSPYPRVSPLIATDVLTNKVNLPKPAAVSVESRKLPVTVSGQPPATANPARERQHKYRVSPGPYCPYSPVICVRGAYDDEFSRWRQGEAKREKLCVERGVPYVERPFDPTGSKARAAVAKTERAVTTKEPVEEPSTTAAEEPSENVLEKPSAPTAASTELVTELAESVESSEPVAMVVDVSAASKVKARIGKVKVFKARAHALLGRQVETMSLINTSVRRVKGYEASPKRKLRSPRRSFEPKPVKRTFAPMDVDYSGDSMELDPPCPVDELADLLSRISLSHHMA
ncbi:hypothetical protein FOMPIDRAFT_92973 [Fomitopsis schrenkii]|uniref:Uncharacterized protein n=1 Tax=Fomitopsis schrenkii TaxID=2126942 RepID=S8F9Q6_FOMSC|nr:hypothetical protein FOMPIDRAFT_92973 [Fomitopsis schrenkii]